MDQLQNGAAFDPSMPISSPSSLIEFRQPHHDQLIASSHCVAKSGLKPEGETMESVTARKLQKADREKLRRERLNEQFLELGNILDPNRPKNDKATIVADTVQLLKDLNLEVEKLKTEYDMLTEESRELTQEKNDLREEKSSLKSDVESLNIQYQQRIRAMSPWGAMDHTVMMAPPSYPYPMPMPMPPGTIPMHPSMQPYPFYGNQNPGVIPAPCPTYMPYITPTTVVEQPSAHVPPNSQPGHWSQDSRSKTSKESKAEKAEDSNDVTTDLELKTPGSISIQDTSSDQRKLKKSLRKERSLREASSSSKCSSSPCGEDSSSNSVVGGRNFNEVEGGEHQQG